MSHTFRRWLLPERERALPGSRAFSIALRTLHLAAFGLLFGGHAVGAPAEQLLPSFYFTLLSGIGLMVVEAYPVGGYWFLMGKGLMVLAKLAGLLLLLDPRFWEGRVAVLTVVIVIASVGSHMPSRYRHYSLLHKRELQPGDLLTRICHLRS